MINMGWMGRRCIIGQRGRRPTQAAASPLSPPPSTNVTISSIRPRGQSGSSAAGTSTVTMTGPFATLRVWPLPGSDLPAPTPCPSRGMGSSKPRSGSVNLGLPAPRPRGGTVGIRRLLSHPMVPLDFNALGRLEDALNCESSLGDDHPCSEHEYNDVLRTPVRFVISTTVPLFNDVSHGVLTWLSPLCARAWSLRVQQSWGNLVGIAGSCTLTPSWKVSTHCGPPPATGSAPAAMP